MKYAGLVGAVLLMLTACKGGKGLFESSGAQALDESNAVRHQYPKAMTDTWKAILAALSELDLKIESDRHDALGGQVVSQRANGDRVTIEARSLDEHNAEVVVATGTIDRNMAGIIHSRIAHLLSTDPVAGEFFGGNSIEAHYDATLAKAVIAADRAFEALNLQVTQRTVEDTRAVLASRKARSTAVLVRMEANGKDQPTGRAAPGDPRAAADQGQPQKPGQASGKIHVTFVVGTTRTPENETMVQRLKAEFERFLK
jgi:uncharacterized protein DUF3568